jgi:hypothetical protein
VGFFKVETAGSAKRAVSADNKTPRAKADSKTGGRAIPSRRGTSDPSAYEKF